MKEWNDFNPEPSGDDIREIASMRWQAVEAFNSYPGLTPLARRVGIALVCFMDAQTRACFPSAPRIAAELGVNRISVEKAKAELKGAGLIDWTNPLGRRGQSQYSFAWSKLLRVRNEAKSKGDLALAERPQRSPQATLINSQSSPQATLERDDERDGERSNVAPGLMQRSPQARQRSLQANGNVVPRLHDTTLYPPTITAQLSTTLCASDAAASRAEAHAAASQGQETSCGIRDPVFDTPQVAPKKEVVEKRRPVSLLTYPSLTSAFKQDAEVLEAMGRMNAPQLDMASRTFAVDGAAVARAFIMMKGSVA